MKSLSGKRGDRMGGSRSLRSFGVPCGCVILVALSSFGACNWDVGPCWINGQDPEKHPIDHADCHSTDPCIEKCIADYGEAADRCTELRNSTERASCEDEAYVFFYEDCRDLCRAESCAEAHADCQEIERCSREVETDRPLCTSCLTDCKAGKPYKFGECTTCGFE